MIVLKLLTGAAAVEQPFAMSDVRIVLSLKVLLFLIHDFTVGIDGRSVFFFSIISVYAMYL